MRKFSWIRGRMIEVHRYISVPSRWHESPPARERREFWLATQQGEAKLVVHTRFMPARAGHEIVCVLHEGRLAAMHNVSTGESLNFARSDPPPLWPRGHRAVLVLLLVGAMVLWVSGWTLASAAALLSAAVFFPSMVGLRALQSWVAILTTERALESARHQALWETRLRRVK